LAPLTHGPSCLASAASIHWSPNNNERNYGPRSTCISGSRCATWKWKSLGRMWGRMASLDGILDGILPAGTLRSGRAGRLPIGRRLTTCPTTNRRDSAPTFMSHAPGEAGCTAHHAQPVYILGCGCADERKEKGLCLTPDGISEKSR
jgi:hypothetical protein